jgi:succinate dehydrogenase flavin-adding protein (antitoxin of CptAB toxin-antitoxin module)
MCFSEINKSNLYNYADDTTLSYSDTDINSLTNVLEEKSKVLITWFNDNQMQANPDKFQATAVDTKTLIYFF